MRGYNRGNFGVPTWGGRVQEKSKMTARFSYGNEVEERRCRMCYEREHIFGIIIFNVCNQESESPEDK
jgi:hypothetical protein